MKKNIAFFTCLLLPLLSLHAQFFDYGNDWYKSDPDRTFIKLIVEEDGIYRVTTQELQSAGFDLSSVNANNLRLYYRGEEVPIYVNKSGTSLNFLEFFGKRNDGQIDSLMYRHPITGLHEGNLQPDRDISLFTDESAYFLTWESTPSPNRYFTAFDPTYGNYTPLQYVSYESKFQYEPETPSSEYIRGGGGPFDSFYTLNSDYVTGEGYMSKQGFGFNNDRTLTVSTPAPANTGNPLYIETRVFGRSNTPHFLKILLNGESSTPIVDTIMNVSRVYINTYKRQYNAVLTDNTDLTFQALRSPTDNNNICFASIRYDRATDLAGDSSILIQDWDHGVKQYLNFSNPGGGDSVYVFDVKNRFRSVGVISGNNARVIIQGFPNVRNLWLTTDVAIKSPRIESSKFEKLFTPGNGAEFVIIAHRGLTASAEAYANYRDTATVNPVSVKVVYTDAIYDEYSFGSLTPWAIKRFCKDAIDHWTIKPRYFLLWGKGRYKVRGYENETMVPTYGYPATDYEFIGHFDPNSTAIKPQAAIGRVNLFSDDSGFDYLAKVNQYEHTPWQPWMKEGVFLGGGGTEGEQNAISSAFQYITELFTGIPYGGIPHYFQKRSSSVILDPTTASYHDEISGGVNVIHFFGHSTSNIQDISIREAFEYNNFSQYPLMIAMGCYGGDFTVPSASFGERWLVYPDRGCIGYLANSSAGYLNPLRDYARVFYRQLYVDQLGEPIGDILKSTMELYTDSLVGIQFRNHGRQLNLQGDPAVICYTPEKPDLAIEESGVYFTPENFTAQDDSFKINIIIENHALVTEDSFEMTIRQRLPNGNFYDHPRTVYPMTFNRDTVTLTLDNPVGNQLTGQNIFNIFVDSKNAIDEYREDNNRVAINRVVPGNIPAILNPPEFAVIGENQVSLQASAFFMTREENVGYVFEIDTSANFSSPLRASSGEILGSATYVSWDVPFTLQDSIVYFWRVRLSKVSPVVWGNSSFRYIAGEEGWAQARLKQFEKDETQTVNIDPIQQQWRFDNFGVEYETFTRKNAGFVYSINGSLEVDLALEGLSSPSAFSGVAFVIIDQFSLEPIFQQGDYGRIGFAEAPNDLYQLKDAISSMKQGDYIIVGSHHNPKVPQWTPDIFTALAEVGVSDNIKLLEDEDPFILLGRKGYPNSATEVYAPTVEDKLVINSVLLTSYTNGQISSPRIGPATTWDKVFWGWNTQDILPQETATISIYGQRFDGTDSLLMVEQPTGSYDLSGVDATLFPYLQLRCNIQDTARRTAPQIDNWHAMFTPAADAVVDPLTNFDFQSDTLFEGQDVFLHMAARNISSVNMDSVKVKITVEREDRSRQVLDTFYIAPLLANGQSVEFDFGFNTLGLDLDGNVLLIVEINPDGDQPEQHLFNNLFVQTFHVIVDRINPLMDVTFDGKHIIDGDYVAPRPEILIEVNDENPYIAMSDSNAFELYFKRGTTAATSFERIFISDSRIEHIPGELPDNKARLYFYPGKDYNLPDGEYTLRVQGRDFKGNASGKGENFYEITFRVENARSVTQVLNYPNPFSTSTRFVYTLTGGDLPEVFQIHIYTISGKLVKVVDLVELGEANIGRHITDYAWDGTDEYGDRLANGVYLYRVVMKMASPELDVELRDEGTAQYFKNGWGKMYLMR